ncbi:MAG: hypothetical protein P4L34_13100 [Paludibacter sp.]|nr:hypothetical protein [Paludibacter sp.]
MDDRKKHKLQPTNPYPHNGNVLKEYFTKHAVNCAELARQLGVSGSSVFQYFESQSLQLGILWKISLALKHNFVAELGEQLSVEYISLREKKLQEQVETLQKELQNLNIELGVYKNIVGK